MGAPGFVIVEVGHGSLSSFGTRAQDVHFSHRAADSHVFSSLDEAFRVVREFLGPCFRGWVVDRSGSQFIDARRAWS